LPATFVEGDTSMSSDSEYERIATRAPAGPDGAEPRLLPPVDEVAIARAPEPYAAPELDVAPEAQVAAATYVAPQPQVAPRPRKRPKWVVPAAIAAAGLIASGALGYLFYSTNTKLDATKHTLTNTQLTLDSTKQQLTAAQADAATKKVTADYLALYTADAGKVRTDYEQVVACSNYATCRTSAQQALTDMQAFQADRKAANVPSNLSTSDSELGDSLSAGIAALQELISGMDNDQATKVKDGFSKLDESMLSMAKAEADLGSALK
jgi:uncharacterized membrane-anchored protein YhcB (DUF1043 family)